MGVPKTSLVLFEQFIDCVLCLLVSNAYSLQLTLFRLGGLLLAMSQSDQRPS